MSLWNFGKSSGSRGVDRVPERFRIRRPAPVFLIQHPYPVKGPKGIGLVKPGGMKTYVNPRRDMKSLKAGRLRKELTGRTRRAMQTWNGASS